MDLTHVEKIADAVLYEGYMLYPYRASSVKNRQRFNWGTVAPFDYCASKPGGESCEIQTQCLIVGSDDTELNVKLRFLHLTDRRIGKVSEPSSEIPEHYESVERLEVDGKLYQPWQEAVEREVQMPSMRLREQASEIAFEFAADRTTEPIRDADDLVAGLIVRTRQNICGSVNVDIEPRAKAGLFRLTVLVRNTTPFVADMPIDRDLVLSSSLVSTHTIVSVENGEFVSLLDPLDVFKNEAAACENKGTYPVLAGPDDQRQTILSSPIILYDYPQIAPESAGDLFDGTEIDEILTLRIMTLTDEEKREVRAIDDRARRMLERTELLPEEQLLKMHGAFRGLEKIRNATHG
jgi:hydrogenase maturation protease